MCLIAVAYRVHPQFPLVVVANRDEFYVRPTQPSAFWSEHPDLLAGRDLEQGGTWLGVTRSGRFAAVTNVRNGLEPAEKHLRSRGELPVQFLTEPQNARQHHLWLQQRSHQYGGYNLLTFDETGLHYHSNRYPSQVNLPPGVYGLSNATLNTPWPKTSRLISALSEALAQPSIDTTSLLNLMTDATVASDELLPDTGVALAWERRLSSCFIRSDDYGTRCTTALTVANSGEVIWREQSFDQRGECGREQFEFRTELSLG